VNIAPLLGVCDVLARAARYGHDAQSRVVCQRDVAPLAEALRADASMISATDGFEGAYARAAELALRGADELIAAEDSPEAVRTMMRSARYTAYVMELMYPFTAQEPALNQWFSIDGVIPMPSGETSDVGVGHLANERGTKGGCSIYVPESYAPDGPAMPLVIALHGGAGHGRTFLWSWLRHARSRGFIVLSPTSVGDTWSLMEPEADVANIARMVEWMSARWRIDAYQMLLTGMSDGGTFSLLGGLQADFLCTHLAPCAASFHPVMLDMVDRTRVQSTPLHLTHGRYDWMFPVAMARQAEQGFRAAGANVTLTEIDDLAHTYPQEHNAALVDWFLR
jgi:phospholipase/carboxylesterase